MELRLSKFITALEKITDVHNLDDANPFMFNMPHPDFMEGQTTQSGLIAQKFRMAVAREEPLNVGLPINGIWINMDAKSRYFRTALKLKAVAGPNESNVSNAITDGGFQQSWIAIGRYERMFDESQYMSIGPAGPKGPQGDKEIVHRLSWDYEREYVRTDGVMFEGGFYVARLANVNTPPADNPDVWYQLSAPGENPVIDYESLVDEIKDRLGWSNPA